MAKKYKLIKRDKRIVYGHILYRIKALRSFGNVVKGDLGGYIESEKNLSHEGSCWVFGDAKVYGSAEVHEDARIYNNAVVFGNVQGYSSAKVYGSAEVYDNAQISGKVKVYDNARIYGSAKIYNNAEVYGNARVYDNSTVYGSARIYGYAYIHNNAGIFGNAEVYGDACVSDSATIFDNARVYGKSTIFGSAKVCGNVNIHDMVHISYNKIDKLTVRQLMFASLNALPLDGYYYLYKSVNKDLTSTYDSDFKYPAKGVVKVSEVDNDHRISCGKGLHVSHLTYWRERGTFLYVKVHENNIISIQQGKVRCKKLTVLGVLHLEETEE